MAVRTVTVTMRLNATSFLADGRAVVRVNNDMSDSFRRLTTDATAASHAADNMADNIRQLGTRARLTERRVRELREEIDRLTAAALAASGPVNVIQGGGAAGGRMGGGFFRALTSAFMALPPELQAAVIVAGTALASIFVTAFGAMLSGALVTAVELVLLGGMVALAAKASNLVQHEFLSTFRPVAQEALRFGLILEGPIVNAIRIMGRAWDNMSYRVRNLFNIVAEGGDVEALAGGLGDLVRNLLPGLEAALSSGVVREFARDLGMVGSSISSMIMSLTRSQGAAKGMRLFMVALSGAFLLVGAVLGWCSDKFDQLTMALEAVTLAASRLPILGKLFEHAADWWSKFNSTGEGSIRTLKGAEGAATAAGQGLDRTGQGARDAEKALHQLNEQLEATVQKMLGLSNARLDFNQGLLDLKKSFEDNGKSLNDHTEKGIANLRMINQQIETAYRARQAFIDQNTATLGLTEATRRANATFAEDMAAIQGVMRAAGLTAAQIQVLTAQWMAMVNSPNLTNKKVVISVEQRGNSIVSTNADGTRTVRKTNFNRYGGLYPARQGLLSGSQMFRPGPTMYAFAERNTGGEAFVAKNAPHDRSLAILAQAARWHLPPAAYGAMAGGGGTVRVELVSGRGGTSADKALAQLAQYAVRTGALQLRVVNGRVAV